MKGVANMMNEKCNVPSDCAVMFPKGCGSPLTLFMTDKNTSICFDSAPKGTTKEEFQKHCDEFTKGTCINTVWRIDDEHSLNVMNFLSMDAWRIDCLKWANARKEGKTIDDASALMTGTINIPSQ